MRLLLRIGVSRSSSCGYEMSHIRRSSRRRRLCLMCIRFVVVVLAAAAVYSG